jgi:hypothetical protein
VRGATKVLLLSRYFAILNLNALILVDWPLNVLICDVI